MSEPRSLRLFIAVPTPPSVRTAAEGVIARLRGAGDVRWVTGDRLHLTLKFLGETPSEKVPAIVEAAGKKSNKFSPFVVELGGVGAFPNIRKPQTLWLGIGGQVEPLVRLAAEVEQALAEIGFPPEGKPFRPHLTLGRVKSPRGLRELARKLEHLAGSQEASAATEWPVEEIHLVRSVLRPAGPEYTPLHRFHLGRED